MPSQRFAGAGRKNWLFFGSDNGDRCLAIRSSDIATCPPFGLTPWNWLQQTLARLPPGLTNSLPSRPPRQNGSGPLNSSKHPTGPLPNGHAQANRPGMTDPPSTIFIGRPSGLTFSCSGFTFRLWQIEVYRSDTLTGLSTGADPSGPELPMT